MNALIALGNPSNRCRKYFYVVGNGKRGYRGGMRKCGIFLLIIHAFISLFHKFEVVDVADAV